MKVSDFKLLSTLPEEYEYEIFAQDTKIMIIGKQHQTIIGFFLYEHKLHPMDFDTEYKGK